MQDLCQNVSDKDKTVQCDLCKLWDHIKCNNHNYLDYRHLQSSNESWHCTECCSTIFPFNSLCSNKNFLAWCTNTDNNNTHWIDLENDHNSSLSLKPSNLELLVSQHSLNSPTLNKVGGRTFQKLSDLRDGPKFLLERRITQRRGGVNVEMGVASCFITLQFNYIYCMCVGKVSFPLLRFDSSVFWVNHARFSSKSL